MYFFDDFWAFFKYSPFSSNFGPFFKYLFIRKVISIYLRRCFQYLRTIYRKKNVLQFPNGISNFRSLWSVRANRQGLISVLSEAAPRWGHDRQDQFKIRNNYVSGFVFILQSTFTPFRIHRSQQKLGAFI